MSVQFIDNSVKVKGILNDKAIQWLLEASGELEAQTKRNSRVRTGETKGSYRYVVDEEKLESHIGSASENAIWEEFGTGEYALNGNGRKGGWVYVDEKGVRHFTYGKHPNRPMYRAFTRLKNRLIQRAQEIFGGSE